MSKITHERMKATIDFNSEYYEEIIDYITQQEKREKLLELYKEALETNFEGITLIKLVNKTLRTQIKELENDK